MDIVYLYWYWHGRKICVEWVVSVGRLTDWCAKINKTKMIYLISTEKSGDDIP